MIDPPRDDRRTHLTREYPFTSGRKDVPGFIRVGSDGTEPGSNYFLDLADGTGRAVKIRGRGWSVVSRSGLQFRRPSGMMPLPVPSRNGSIDLLRPYVNLTDRDFRRAIVWLASALLPSEPHPILMIRGDEGTAKTTLAELLRRLVDPHVRPLIPPPEDAGDMRSTALDRWMLAYDDVGAISGWFATALCDLVRGPAIASGPVSTSAGATSPLGARPVILSGIEDVHEQCELNQVAISLNLQPIFFDNRRDKSEFWRSFQADYSRILGGLLDILAEGLLLAQAERKQA